MSKAFGAPTSSAILAQPVAERNFICTEYSAGEDGGLRPAWPGACPFREPGGAACSLHHLRDRARKTGPRHPLAVLQCATHGRAFTVYPPGFGPYMRAPVVRLSPDGGEVAAAGDDGSDVEATIFEAARDAAAGRAWDRGPPGTITDRWWSSQGRLLGSALRLLGLAADQADHLRDAVAQVLSVGGLLLREQAVLAAVGGYRARGVAILAVISAMKRTATRALRLLTCAHVTGRFGQPLEWDPKRRRFWTVPFRLAGTAPPS